MPDGEESADRQPAVAPDARAPGLMLGEDVRVGEGVRFGAHVVVHTGSIIGAGCVIEDHAVLGKRPRLAKGSAARGDVGRLELRELGAEVGYHDPHVPALNDFALSSRPLEQAVNDADVVVIVTAHPDVDHELVAKRARLLVDLRGVTRSFDAAHVVRL